MKRIVVCMKQVPSSASVGFDPGTNNLDRGGVAAMINPADTCALEAALSIRDRTGCEVAALTMGRERAGAMLREAAECGATELYLVSDPAFAGSDSFATATILAASIRYIGGADLVICGRRAIDGETGQTGPELAAMLSLPSLTNLIRIEYSGGASIVCVRLGENCSETFEVSLPALLAVCEGMSRLRPPSIAAMRRARGLAIHRIDNAILGLDAGKIGARGSFTRVRALFPPEEAGRKRVVESDPAAGATAACSLIAELLENNR